MSKINPYMYREYDIRGIYPDLNYDSSYKTALAYHKVLPDIKTVVIGQDVRASSDEVKKGFIDGLVAVGIRVTDIGTVPIPVVLFANIHYHYDGGIMITGSHNPKEYTGIKIHKAGACPVYGEELHQIRDCVLNNDLPVANRQGSIEEKNVLDEYIQHTIKNIKISKPLKIVIDVGNGVCGYLPEKIFKKSGCRVKTLYGEFDSNFPHHLPDPYEPKNLQDLIVEVKKEKADLGFAYDGDGDRTGFIDNQGNIMTGNDILLMLARKTLEKYQGAIVCETRTSLAFLEEMAKLGARVIFSVGFHTAILNNIVAHKDAVFGGETTGHIYFPRENYLYDDAIFASLKLAEIASEQTDFTGYINSLPRYVKTPELFIDSDDAKKKQLVENFIELVKKKQLEFIDVDGARVVFPKGWASVRMSNTTPLIKAIFEGKTQKDLKEIVDQILPMMTEAGIELSDNNKKVLDEALLVKS
jgi:phosphomannomutase/phosphoglucomutase